MAVLIGDAKTDSQYNFIAFQGVTWIRPLLWLHDDTDEPIDLTDFTATFIVKKIYPKTFLNPLYGSSAVVSLTESAGIELGGVDGTITITIDGGDTEGIYPDIYNYDLILTADDNTMTKLMYGYFEFIPTTNFIDGPVYDPDAPFIIDGGDA